MLYIKSTYSLSLLSIQHFLEFWRMATSADNNPALNPDTDTPSKPGLEFAEFGAGCFWGVELSFQRVPGVVKTEVGYSQGHVQDPNYKLVCSGTTNHVEVVRVQFDPELCPYTNLLSLFWGRHDPTTPNRQVPWNHVISVFLCFFGLYLTVHLVGPTPVCSVL